MKKPFLFLLLVVGVALTVSTTPARADLILTFDQSFPGSDKPDPFGSAPWLTATFTDSDTNEVTLLLEANLQHENEFISKVWFNFCFDDDLANLNITPTSTDTDPVLEDVLWGKTKKAGFQPNQYKADGDGNFDILFEFGTANDGRFDRTDSISFTLTYGGNEAFGADSFDTVSLLNGGEGIWKAAAHVQGLDYLELFDDNDDPIDSTWIGHRDAVPEPATMLLLGSGLIGLAAVGRKKFRRKP